MLLILGIVIILLLWTLWNNTALRLSTYSIESERIPDEFSGYRIAQVSDLHNTKIGRSNETLLSLLQEIDPSIIAITGDLIDSRKTDVETALEFAAEAVKIAPCYYISGNHEARIADYTSIKEELAALGVTILDDTAVTLTAGSESIRLLGIEDPSFQTDYLHGDSESVISKKLQTLTEDDNHFQILLSHRPELFSTYSQYNVNLVLSGHAHGGQFRLPLIGGLYAPNQGVFPKYDAGIYADGETQMVVSRGIGNSIIPLRINNNPELVLIELQSARHTQE